MVRYFKVHPALQEYIEYIVYVHYTFEPGGLYSSLYTFVPSHTRFIAFYLGDPVKVKKSDGRYLSRGRMIVIGPQLSTVTLDLGSNHKSFIVAFKPGCMHRLLKVPLKEIVDMDFNGDEIIGPEVKLLNSRLSDTDDPDKQFLLIQQFFHQRISKLKPMLPFDRAMQVLVNSGGNMPIELAAGQACLSLRQFERHSLERIGFTPKFYSRLVRFSTAYMLKELSPDLKWSEIAYKCGYFDQMHFIRDFKNIAGFLPKSLLKEDIHQSVCFQKISLLGDPYSSSTTPK